MAPSIPYTPIDPQLIQTGRNVLDYLAGLSARTSAQGKKVLSGQYHLDHAQTVFNETGIWVGLIQEHVVWSDNTGTWPYDVGATGRINAQTYWNAGGLVQINFCPGNPKTHGYVRDTNFAVADWTSVITEDGNAINSSLRQELDIAVGHLQWLSALHIPVLFRPYFEQCQAWAWWGLADSDIARGCANFIALWRYTINYVKARVHNCIYVFASDNYPGSGHTTANCVSLYPGDAYVDIVGADQYKDVYGTTVWGSSDFDVLNALADNAPSKIVSIPEMGQKAAITETHTDLRKQIDGIRNYGPRAVYFSNWSYEWSLMSAYNDYALQLLSDPWIVNRSDLPRFSPVTDVSISYTGAGTTANANNASISPGLPTGWQATSDNFIAFVFYSSPAGTVTTPAGWIRAFSLSNADGKLYVYTKVAAVGDVAPTFAVSGGSSGDGIVGNIIAVRCLVPLSIFASGADTANTSQQNIPVTAPSAVGSGNGGAVIFYGGKNSGYCVSNPFTGDSLTWTEAFDSSAGAYGVYHVADIALWGVGTAPTLTDKTFVVTGGSAATSLGKAFILAPGIALATASSAGFTEVAGIGNALSKAVAVVSGSSLVHGIGASLTTTPALGSSVGTAHVLGISSLIWSAKGTIPGSSDLEGIGAHLHTKLNDWSTQNFRWNDRFYFGQFPYNLFGDEFGRIYKVGTVEEQDGNPIRSFARFGLHAAVDGNIRGLVRRVYPFAGELPSQTEGLSVIVYVTDQMGGEQIAGPASSYDLTHKTRRFVNPFVPGRFYCVEFGTDGVNSIWELQGYDVDVVPLGERDAPR